MSQNQFPPLSAEEIEHFIQHGHVVIHDCFSREFAKEWTANAFRRLGYNPNDPMTWVQEIIHMPASHRVPMQEIAPKAWQAACERIDPGCKQATTARSHHCCSRRRRRRIR